ncbi:MAG: hypothetical protein DHS20C14_01220 [Phycisphaeraceae bacterium]|nr:MAG: hypothetical protein DHS20C14_01220 [Phycisphaeraceae bacterium]
MTRTQRNQTKNRAARTVCAAGLLAVLAGVAPGQTFQRFNGTDATERAYDIEETFGGGYVTAGERDGMFDPAGGIDPSDMLVTRYDVDGKPIWSTQIGGFARDVAYSVHQASNGDFIVAGMTESVGPILGLVISRLDPTGIVLWTHAYPGDVFFELFNPGPDGTRPQVAVRESRETGDIIAVTNVAPTAGGQLGEYVRTTAAGIPLVEVTYSIPALGPLTEMGFSDLKELPNGDVVITGFINTRPPDPLGLPPDFEVLAMRIAPGGAPIWANATGELLPDNPAQEVGYGIDVGPNGTPLVIGASTDAGGPLLATSHLWLDAGGVLLFNNQVDGMVPAYAATRFNDNLDVATGAQDFFLPGPGAHGTAAGISFDAVGSPLWLYTYGPNLNPRDRATGVTPVRFGESVCGWAFSAWEDYPLAIGGDDQHLIKVNDLGSSGCCEDRIPMDVREPVLQQLPLQFQLIGDEQFEPWGNWARVGLVDVIKCYHPTCTPCVVDFDGNGLLNVDDIDLFVMFFTSSDARADLDCNGLLNVDDIDRFVALFLGGC